MEMLQNLMRNFRDRYHSVWWCSLVRFTIYFSSVVVLSFGEVCEGGNRNWIHLCLTTPHILTIPLLIMHSWSFGSFTTKKRQHVTSVCRCFLLFLVLVLLFSVRCTECSFYPHRGVLAHFTGAIFCHCNYHPHRSICEAQEFMRVGDFKELF